MACCIAIIERCTPAGETVIGFVDKETATTTYLLYPALTEWAGDESTLVKCESTGSGAASKFGVTENADGTIEFTHDPGDGTGPTTETVGPFGGGGTVDLNCVSVDSYDTATCTATTSVSPATTTDVMYGEKSFNCNGDGSVNLGDNRLVAVNRVSDSYISGLPPQIIEDTPVGTEITFATHNVSVPCDMDVHVTAQVDVWNRNTGVGDVNNGVLRGTVWEILPYVDGVATNRISGILRNNNKASSEEAILVGTGGLALTKGDHVVELKARLFENTLLTDHMHELTQAVSSVQWTELTCC